MIDDALGTDPELLQLLQLLRELLRSQAVSEVLSSFRKFNHTISVPNLLVLSELCYQISPRREIEYALMNRVFLCFKCVLAVARTTGESVDEVLSSLSTDAFHPTQRSRQKLFKQSADYIAEFKDKETQDRMDAFLTGRLLAWSWLARPQWTVDPEEAFTMMIRLDDEGIRSLPASQAGVLGAAQIVWRAFWKSKLLNSWLKRVIAIAARLMVVGVFIALVILLTRVSFSSSYGWTVRVGAGIGCLVLFTLPAVFVEVARFRHLQKSGMLAMTVGTGDAARILIQPGLAEDQLRKALRHEFSHLAKELGYVKRDLASLVEGSTGWCQGTLKPYEKVSFDKGFDQHLAKDGMVATIDRYLKIVDSATGEFTNDYSLGYYILGVIVKLCGQDKEGVTSFIRALSDGESAGYALNQVDCLRHLETVSKQALSGAPLNRIQEQAAWIGAYIKSRRDGALFGEYSRSFEAGLETSKPETREDCLKDLESPSEDNDSMPRDVHCYGVIAGSLLARSRGDFPKTLSELKRIYSKSTSREVYDELRRSLMLENA